MYGLKPVPFKDIAFQANQRQSQFFQVRHYKNLIAQCGISPPSCALHHSGSGLHRRDSKERLQFRRPRCEGAVMSEKTMVILDGNEAAASVAYRLTEVVAIYPSPPRRRWPSGPISGARRARKTFGAHCLLWKSFRAKAARLARCMAHAGRGLWHDFYRLAGPAADDSQYVQDCR